MKLKEYRLAAGLSVPKLSEKSGVPIRTIEDIEKRKDCRLSTALLLAKALNITLDELAED